MGLRAERVEDVHAGGAHGGEEPAEEAHDGREDHSRLRWAMEACMVIIAPIVAPAEENSAIIIPTRVRNMVVSRWPA